MEPTYVFRQRGRSWWTQKVQCYREAATGEKVSAKTFMPQRLTTEKGQCRTSSGTQVRATGKGEQGGQTGRTRVGRWPSRRHQDGLRGFSVGSLGRGGVEATNDTAGLRLRVGLRVVRRAAQEVGCSRLMGDLFTAWRAGQNRRKESWGRMDHIRVGRGNGEQNGVAPKACIVQITEYFSLDS